MRIFIIFLFVSGYAFALPPEASLPINQNVVSYFSNYLLDQENSAIEQAVIVIHGSERNANTYYSSMENVAAITGHQTSALIIAPHFKLATDALSKGELTWTDEGWLSGDNSLVNSKLSSFDVLDIFISKLANKSLFPNLKKITITGHSAGGQMTQRFALGSILPNLFYDINFHFVPLNPGSYVYLSSNRKFPDAEKCAFNDYKYGLDHLNEYMSRLKKDLMISNYLDRQITYLVGELDNNPRDIDQSCPARYQGSTRLVRAQAFYDMLKTEFASVEHKLYVIPNVAHTQYGMYHSEIGKNIIWQNKETK
jgi:hypothetical protein